MRQIRANHYEATHFTLFAGMGGLSLGLTRGCARVGTARASMRCLGGVDAWPAAVRDFERINGTPATVLDLFAREDYIAWHGKEPPADWREATADDIRAAAGGEFPDILATSPPCKGFSGLLNAAAAASDRYAALNRLTIRGLALALEAFADNPPSMVLLENVPRIQTRGRDLVDTMKALLRAHGYAVAETVHDCGVIGGLAQHRRRFLLVARHTKKVQPFLYEPPSRRVRGIGEVLSQLPMPESAGSGPMHRLPRLTWQTWVRLALISAGKDWRSLHELVVEDGYLRDIALVADGTDWHGGVLGVRPWDTPSATVKGRSEATTGSYAVADPRSPMETRYQPYGVVRWDDASRTVTSQSAAGAGPYSVADPRLDCDVNDRQTRRHNNVLRLMRWDEAAQTVTAGGGLARATVADPRNMRLGTHSGKMGVQRWTDAARTITGSDRVGSGAQCVSDPRTLPAALDRPDPVPLIIALDDTWHRPLTTLELAALQGYPVFDDAGEPMTMDGRSDAGWRERIGNSVPVQAAQAIGDEMVRTLLLEAIGTSWVLSDTPVWVQPYVTALAMTGLES